MKLLLYPHGGSGNHGCEAIVRATVALTGADVLVASSAVEEDRRYALDNSCDLFDDRTSLDRAQPAYWKAFVRYHFFGEEDAFDKLVFRPVMDMAQDCDFALSIGGDNYCYGQNVFMLLINKEMRKKKIRSCLWGCSIDPASLRGALLEDLRGYEWIVARESLSFEALKRAGLSKVRLLPDPAFCLKREEAILPEGFVEGNTVGINISPLILAYEKRPGIILENCKNLVHDILVRTDMSVALIPHVVQPGNDDREVLTRLYALFPGHHRVVLAADQPAAQLKDLIARCRFMVGARTHACIAAYSSQVPTIALGYSMKAKGLAQDIMPPSADCVLAVQALDRPKELSDLFFQMISCESELRSHLNALIPDYVGRWEKENLTPEWFI